MFSLIEIIKSNNLTFYDYASGKPLPQTRRNLAKLAGASALTIFFCGANNSFSDALLTTYSILLGFGFNILFYLISIMENNREKVSSKRDDASLEKNLKAEKLQTLQKELFHNILYFDAISILIVIFLMVEFLFIGGTIDFLGITTAHRQITEYTTHTIALLYKFILFFLLIESLYTFFRTMERVSYYFREKIGAK